MAEPYAHLRIRVCRWDQEWMIKYLSEAGPAVRFQVEPSQQVPLLIKEFESFDAPLLWLAWQ